MKVSKLALIVAIAALACGAFAQGGGGGGGRQRGGRGFGGNPYAPMTILRNEDVQKEIGLTDDQKTKVEELRTSTTAKMTEVRSSTNGDQQAAREGMMKVNADALKSLGEILKPEQLKRLRELEIQWTGITIVTSDKEAQATLGITDDQKAKIAELQKKQQAANAEARQSANGDRAAIREATQKNAKIMEDELAKVLTDDQKAKLKDLGGKEMAKPAPPQRGGGGF